MQFFLTIRAKVEALQLDEPMAQVVLEQLIPAVYLSYVSKRTSDRQERQELEERSRLMLAPPPAPTSPFAHLSSTQLQEIEKVAIECAMLWKLNHLV